MADIIRQIKVGNTPYDIHAYDRYIDEKTYTGLIGTENNWKNGCYYFLTVIPTDWNAEWTVKYRLEVTLDDGVTSSNYQYYRSNHECLISGTRGVYTAYSFFNSISSTSYRTIYYHTNHNTTSAGFTAGQGHKIGISFQSAANPTSTSYKRTIRVILEQAINCTATLAANNAALEIPASSSRTGYTKLNSTYFTESNSNSAGNYNLLDAYSNGLRETGDDNTTTQLNLYLNYLKNATTYEDGSAGYLLGYTLFGLDKDGKAMAFSKKTPTQTAYNADPSTTRVYCNKGFDYTKGVFYINSSSNFAAGADLNVSPLKFQTGVDLRYTDNCVASTSATTLGIIYREPVYLRGTIGSDGLFYVDPITVTYSSNSYKRAWVQPSDTSAFDTSHVYWFIGYGYYNSSYTAKAYQLDLHSSDSLMKWDGEKLVPYIPSNDTNQTVKGNGTAFGANDAVDIVGGGNVTVTGDSTNKKITVSYTTPASLPANGGNAASLGGSAPAYYLSYGNFTNTPTSLKNPNPIHIYGETTKVLEYDGSASKSLYIKSSTTAGAFTVSDGTTSKLIQLTGSFTDTTYGAQSGITLANSKYGHANTAITAGTTQSVYSIKYDSYGHITAATAVTIPTNTNQTVKTSNVTFGANDVVEISAGSNVTVTGDATNKRITISATAPAATGWAGTLSLSANSYINGAQTLQALYFEGAAYASIFGHSYNLSINNNGGNISLYAYSSFILSTTYGNVVPAEPDTISLGEACVPFSAVFASSFYGSSININGNYLQNIYGKYISLYASSYNNTTSYTGILLSASANSARISLYGGTSGFINLSAQTTYMSGTNIRLEPSGAIYIGSSESIASPAYASTGSIYVYGNRSFIVSMKNTTTANATISMYATGSISFSAGGGFLLSGYTTGYVSARGNLTLHAGTDTGSLWYKHGAFASDYVMVGREHTIEFFCYSRFNVQFRLLDIYNCSAISTATTSYNGTNAQKYMSSLATLLYLNGFSAASRALPVAAATTYATNGTPTGIYATGSNNYSAIYFRCAANTNFTSTHQITLGTTGSSSYVIIVDTLRAIQR